MRENNIDVEPNELRLRVESWNMLTDTGSSGHRNVGCSRMPFRSGQPKTPGSGRKRGVPDKRTRIAREGAKTAIELLSRKGLDPISVQQELIQVMRDVADVILGRDKPDAPPLAERISNLPPGRLELALKAIDMACHAQSRLTAFRYPKLEQVTVNDAMADQTGAA